MNRERVRQTSVKQVVKAMSPPAMLTLGREVRRRVRGGARAWEHLPNGWSEPNVADSARGWDVAAVPTLHARHWLEFATAVEAPHPLSVAPEHAANAALTAGPYGDVDVYTHHVVMTVAYALAIAGRGHTSLSVLDWGGGVGHYSVLFRSLFPDMAYDYHVKDMPTMTAEGRRLAPDVTFHDDDSCLDRTYDFVVSSSSLQYSQDWQHVLGQLGGATDGFLFVSQIPVVHDAASFVIIQRPYAHGYDTEYVSWCFNRTELMAAANTAGLELKREFVHGFKPAVHGAPEQPEYRGFLFGKLG